MDARQRSRAAHHAIGIREKRATLFPPRHRRRAAATVSGGHIAPA